MAFDSKGKGCIRRYASFESQWHTLCFDKKKKEHIVLESADFMYSTPQLENLLIGLACAVVLFWVNVFRNGELWGACYHVCNPIGFP